MNEAARNVDEVLRERARALAQPPERAVAEDAIELLEFRLAQERYALQTRFVLEVHPLRDLTPLPATPDFLRGVLNVRGRIVPVIDMKRFFGLPETGLTDLHRVVLVQGGDMELGVLADVVVGVRSVPLHRIQVSPPTPLGIRAEYLMGVTDDHLIVIDMDRVLSDPKIIVQDEADV